VCLATRVDGTADLGDPEGHSVVDEDREGERELVSVEGALRLADDDGREPSSRVPEVGEEA
jgi:hypothetical protein